VLHILLLKQFVYQLLFGMRF